MQTLILQIFKVPYFYILLGILLIIILCIMFNKRIKSLLKNINIHVKKTNILALDCTTTQNSKVDTVIEINNIEIENSKTGEIEGKVSMHNVKITDSTVGSIRGR